MPLYLKAHSQGEYIFDHAWADAYERAGGRYYPKLVSAAPFSPVTGPRLISRAGDAGRAMLVDGALALCKKFGVSTVGINFPTREEWDFMGERGLLLRQNQQYHWHNPGYATFEDFLASLSSNRRKTIRRERRDAVKGLEIVRLTGADLTEDAWDAFFEFYMDTGSRKWGSPYLNRPFFSMLGERMGDKVLLIMAKRGGRWIAGALNLLGADCVYGRNWGCVEDVPFLHFELCYLSGHRSRHREPAGAGRGGGAGPTQDRAGLSADSGLFRTLHRRPRAARARRAVPGGREAGGAGRDGLARRGILAVQAGGVMSWPPEVELRGNHAWLIPLRPDHAANLAEASAEGELWRIWYTNVPKPEDMAEEIEARLAKQAAGGCLPFAVLDPATMRAVGMTCYWNVDAEAKRVEIGATWYRRSVSARR